MRLATSIAIFVSVLIGGCSTQSVDCASGGAKGDCPPGTQGYELKAQQQQTVKTFAAIDKARCVAFGEPGSQAYADCLRRASAEHQEFSGSH
jgi:hypothetical protein